MTALDDLVSTWPHQAAVSVLRLARIMEAKDVEYWETRGRGRFQRELAADGLSAEQIAQALSVADGEFSDVDLDRVLRQLKARSGPDYGGGGRFEGGRFEGGD